MGKNYICAFYKWLKRPYGLYFDRTIASKSYKQWRLPILCIIIPLFSLLLIFWGLNGGWTLSHASDINQTASGASASSNIFEAAYYHLITNGGQNLLTNFPIIGLIFTTIGIIIIAILTSSITNFLEQRAKGYINGETRYRNISNHYVILGANDIIYSIIREITGVIKHNGYIIIQTGKDVEKTRREVFSFIDCKIHKKIIFYFGERTSEDDMRKLNLDSAKEVFIIGDGVENDGRDSYRDAYNIDSIEAIYNVLKEKDVPICEKRDLKTEK
ncbi:MAG: hypothetical protein IKI67_06815, partial [Bacteroidales bacterium]|nr:hypothetical protein [Bacteroidales bacterium]